MKTIKINSIEIENFKGISSLKLNIEGKNISIFGRNGAGKSSVKDAIQWLVSGKNSLGRADFAWKPTADDGTEKHHLATMVQIGFMVDGKTTVLRKECSEVWDKGRKKLKTHKADYRVNGDDIRLKNDFDRFVSEIFPPEAVEILTNPTAFGDLHPDKMRSILYSLGDDVPDQHVIDGIQKNDGDDLKILADIVAEGRIKIRQQTLKRDIKKLGDDLHDNEVKTKEKSRTKEPPAVSIQERGRLKEDLANTQKRLVLAENGSDVVKWQNDIDRISNEILTVRNSAPDVSAERSRVGKELSAIEIDQGRCIGLVERFGHEIEAANQDLSRQIVSRENLIKKWGMANRKKFDPENVCANCEQPMPIAMIEKACGNFNEAKAEELRCIAEAGLLAKRNIAIFSERIEKLKSDIEAEKIKSDALLVGISKKKVELESIKPIVDTVKIAKLEQEKAEVQANIDKAKSGSTELVDSINIEIKRINTRLDEIATSEGLIEAYKADIKRIEELENEAAEIAVAKERLEAELDLIGRFIYRQAEMSEKIVNDRFADTGITFQLFESLITTGEIIPCCKMRLNGVKYSDVNHAGRINAGLKIVERISEKYGVTLPLIIDDANLVLDFQPTTAQQILLVAEEVFECECGWIGIDKKTHACGDGEIEESNKLFMKEEV